MINKGITIGANIVILAKLIDVMYLHVKENELIINRNIPYILNFNNKPAKNNDIEVADSEKIVDMIFGNL